MSVIIWSVLFAIAVWDARDQRIPNSMVLLLIVVSLVWHWQLTPGWMPLLQAFGAGAVLFLFYFLYFLVFLIPTFILLYFLLYYSISLSWFFFSFYFLFSSFVLIFYSISFFSLLFFSFFLPFSY